MKKCLFIIYLLAMVNQTIASQNRISMNEPFESVEINPFLSYWIDENDQNLGIYQAYNQAFRPFQDLENLRKNSKKIIWLRFKIKQTIDSNIRPILYLGRFFFLDLYLFDKNTRLISHTQAGTFERWAKDKDGYGLEIPLNKNQTYEVYIRLGTDIFYSKNIYTTPKLYTATAYIKHQQYIFKGKKSLSLLLLSTIGFLLCGTIVAFSQYLSSRQPPVMYYLIATIISAVTILKIAEFNLDFRLISDFFPPFTLLTFIFQLLQCLSFYVLITQIFNIKQKLFTKLNIPILVSMLVIECLVIALLLHYRAMLPLIYYWYIGSLLVSDGIILIIVFYTINLIDDYNKYIIYGFFFAFSLFGVTFYLGTYQTQTNLFSKNLLSIPATYICFGTIVEFIFFMIALSKKIQAVEQESLIKGQANERNRIAGELHDNVNGLLASVKLTLQVFKPNPEQIGIYQNLLRMIDNATQEVRYISHNMIPFELEKRGLKASLEGMMHQFKENNHIQIQLDTDKLNFQLKLEIEFNLYLICFELCQNLIINDKITKIRLEFDIIGAETHYNLYDKSNIYMFIWCDQIATLSHRIHELRLHRSIRHKAQSIGAEFHIKYPNEGVIYVIKLPYRHSVRQ